MVPDKVDHKDGGGRDRCRDHARTAAGDRDDHGDREGGLEGHLGIDPRDDREADGFRDQGEGDDDAGEHVAANVEEPVPAYGVEDDRGTL